jgi:hypothetical protein
MEGGENRWKYWVHTVELILQGHRRRYVGVQKFAQRLRIKSELMQFTGDFLETFLKLTVGNCMINPMGGKILSSKRFLKIVTKLHGCRTDAAPNSRSIRIGGTRPVAVLGDGWWQKTWNRGAREKKGCWRCSVVTATKRC